MDKAEAIRLKSLAEEKYKSSNLKSALKYAKRAHNLRPTTEGLFQMVTALKVLRAASKDPSDWYRILDVEPFSHANVIKGQYKRLALILHPDKATSVGSVDAFKLVCDAFRVLSDKPSRKDYDLRLRLSIAGGGGGGGGANLETFWTACGTCRVLHEFERRYVGHRLVCPGCKKSFLAVEVSSDGDGGGGADRTVRRARSKRARPPEKTLAEMQADAKRKAGGARLSRKSRREKVESAAVAVSEGPDGDDLAVMAVEDPDFYDFDGDRVERSFKKGQVWAVYDDDDGMPRHYGLITDVASVNPFKVRMSWMDLQINGDESLIGWEKMGFHVSCGRFKVGRAVVFDSVNLFSHPVECERAAREIYRIYPKKGSVWALYGEGTAVGGDRAVGDGRGYDVVVCLTSYSDLHGLSMAYLEKVEGFKTVFKRREIGGHAIRWLEKDDVRSFSHQIPARKLEGSEAPGLPNDCWELDPASLPSHLLSIAWKR
ncbi:hypothetical protein QJS04_geneDACA012177 [Acorus gramineus]|uniref:J domain-containing protein n=1 Tax=Acorus gramineus TaxID=55184 RepID=A0AAV9BBR6_ACOGR|nr:hypothetical protein QJS04_geneDACA012177 [Acorus gramineus]